MNFFSAFVYAVLSAAMVKLFKWLYSYYTKLRIINKIKGPKIIPFFGNVLQFKKKYGKTVIVKSPNKYRQYNYFKNFIKEFYKQLMQYGEEYKKETCFRLWTG